MVPNKKTRTRKSFLTVSIIIGLLGLTALAFYIPKSLHEKALREEEPKVLLAELSNQTAHDQQELSEAEIVTRYEPRFERLEEMALERLETLFNTALVEYEESKPLSNNERMKLANKYLQAGKRLEKTFDATFDILLNEMITELKAHGHSSDVAKTIKDMYKQIKDEKKEELLERLKDEIRR